MAQHQAKQNSRLVKLAPELRNRIYSELLESDETLALIVDNEDRVRPREGQVLHPNILATCRLIYEEASSILYGSNKFEMSTCAATKFLDPQNSMQLIHLRHLELTPGLDNYREVRLILACLLQASSLEVLSIPVRWPGKDYQNHLKGLTSALRNWIRAQQFERARVGKRFEYGTLRLYSGGAESKAWYVRMVERYLARKLQQV